MTQPKRSLRYLDQIHNPVALARKYLAMRHLLGRSDEDDLMDVAIQAIVDAALAWDPNGGRSILSWAYLYLDRNVYREIGRRMRERSELGSERCVSDDDGWTRYDDGTDEYHRVELRVDLQRWADLAELTSFQRFVIEYAAHHKGVYVRDTPLADQMSPLRGGGAGTLNLALKHMRRAALTNERRDDKWTRMRDRAGRDAKSDEAVRFWRDQLNRPLVDRTPAPKPECGHDGCEREAVSRGMCDKHYRQVVRGKIPA